MLIDTNLLIRLASPTDSLHATAGDAVDSLIDDDETLCIVPQNLYEVWAVATRPVSVNGLGMSTSQAEALMTRFKSLFRLMLDFEKLYEEWQELVVLHQCKGKVAHDARLVAAMQLHGIDRILTFNVADFARYPGITAVDPASVT